MAFYLPFLFFLFTFTPLPEETLCSPNITVSGGEWNTLQNSIGISAMHMQLLSDNSVIMFDRTDFGASNISLPNGKCRLNDEALHPDCTAHSVLYDILSNTVRPLTVQTDVWCPSGAVDPNGTLVQTGGFDEGEKKIRVFAPCRGAAAACDWTELSQNLTVKRWYASDHILPDGRVIVIGGREEFSYEFFPKNFEPDMQIFNFPFLKETSDSEENNLYPFVHLLPNGNLFIHANRRSIELDYMHNRVVKEFPLMPGEKRNYPSTGSSVLLPIHLTGVNGSHLAEVEVEVLICGGANGGAFTKAGQGIFDVPSRTCGRLKLTDPSATWAMEEMPMPRVMSDMLLLPTGHIIIINGAARGSAGWDHAIDPVLSPLLYMPDDHKFIVLTPTTVPRMYHSSALLLPDGRILVGGSNPHQYYNFTGVWFPTELSIQAYSPSYMAAEYEDMRPSITSVGASVGVSENAVAYGQGFSIVFTLGLYDSGITVAMIAPSFTTHSFAMNQRMLLLEVLQVEKMAGTSYRAMVYAPGSPTIAPPGYYMLFVVNSGVPSHSVWMKMG